MSRPCEVFGRALLKQIYPHTGAARCMGQHGEARFVHSAKAVSSVSDHPSKLCEWPVGFWIQGVGYTVQGVGPSDHWKRRGNIESIWF